MHKRKGVKWDWVDWSKTNLELAEEYGVVVRTVAKARQRRGIQNPKTTIIEFWKWSSQNKSICDLDYEFAMCSKGDGRKKPSKSWRKAVLNYHGEKCVICHYHNPPVKTHSHHIVPMSEGGKNTIRNGVVLCSRCHDEVHAGLISILPNFESAH